MSVAQLGGTVAPGGAGPGEQEVAQEKRRGRAGYLLLLPGILWLIVFFIVPTIQLAATALYDPNGSLDTGYAMTWSFSNYLDAMSQYSDQFLRSFLYAGIATVLCLLLGYPLAYAIAFKSGRWKNLMLVLVIAPFFTSFLVRTLAWKSILSDNGFIVETLKTLSLIPEDGRLLATPVAVVTGLTYNFLPFMVLPLYANLEKIDPRLVEAGKDLYANGVTAFRRITLPLSMPGVVAGTLLTFIPAAGDYINSELLGTPQQRMIGNVIDNLFLVQLDYPAAAASSVLLMVAIVLLVLFYVRRAGHGGPAYELAVWAVGQRPRRDVRGAAGARLHVPADLLRRADVVQRPDEPAQLRVPGVHAGQLDRPVLRGRHVRLGGEEPADRLPGHGLRDPARHAGRLRAGPAPVPRPRRDEPADLPADGDARGRDGLLAAGALHQRRAWPGRWASGRSWSRTSCSACRSWW